MVVDNWICCIFIWNMPFKLILCTKDSRDLCDIMYTHLIYLTTNVLNKQYFYEDDLFDIYLSVSTYIWCKFFKFKYKKHVLYVKN